MNTDASFGRKDAVNVMHSPGSICAVGGSIANGALIFHITVTYRQRLLEKLWHFRKQHNITNPASWTLTGLSPVFLALSGLTCTSMAGTNPKSMPVSTFASYMRINPGTQYASFLPKINCLGYLNFSFGCGSKNGYSEWSPIAGDHDAVSIFLFLDGSENHLRICQLCQVVYKLSPV